MAAFKTCFDAKCSAFKITRLIYVHCVSREEFSVHLKGLECVLLQCREIHWSYLESLSKRRVCLVPQFVDDEPVEELFAGLWSPVLIRINCSCDINFVNPEDNSEESTGALMWDFEVLRRNSSAVAVQASNIEEAKDIDAFCHPVDITQSKCNCGKFSPNMSCLVYVMTYEEQNESDQDELEAPDLESLSLHDPNDDFTDDEDDLDDEIFKVKGSYHEEQYQQALLKCDNVKRNGQTVPIRAEFEPDNIQDKNAIKFEVFLDNEWLIIGYCDVKKIPKLRTAVKEKEIKSFSLSYVKREFIPWQGKLCFYACICIVKKGKWGKDTNNYYNSNLDC